MVNYQMFGLCTLLERLRAEEAIFRIATIQAATGPEAADPTKHLVPQIHRERLAGMLTFATQCADRLELQGVHDRIELFHSQLRRDLVFQECAIQLRTLKEAFDSGIQYASFFHYKRDRAALLNRAPSDWAEVIGKIADLKDNVIAAVDCYALDHNLASVFHLMLIMERGVQAFGKKLGVDLVKENPGKRVSELTWDQILNNMNPRLRGMPQDTVAKKRRHEKYSAVQAYLYAVKDAWRNTTMHPRDSGYTSPQNLDLLTHVRSFMTGLAHVL
jgi:hypothetical protein